MKLGEEKKVKHSILRSLKLNQERNSKSKRYDCLSSLHTKLELPILYSNLITIEDMKFENSNYFVRSNGFSTNKIKLSSMKHDNHFSMSDCVFRIFPKTYNLNKYKVLESINSDSISKEEEINFKFESELFNNLDIVESKFGQPVRYGDTIILMHESSKKFIKFDAEKKNLVLSNHDSESTLFSVTPFCEIMLNDDQVVKTGQPIKLKVASFVYADQNLYFSTHFPYEERQIGGNLNENYIPKGIEVNRKRKSQNFEMKWNLRNIQDKDDNQFNLDKINSNSNGDNSDNDLNPNNIISPHSQNISDNSQHIINDDAFDDKTTVFDKANKLYLKAPEIIIEEDSNMRWRFNLYSTFTTDETLLVFGDFVNILHCRSNAMLTIDNIKESDLPDNTNEDKSEPEIDVINKNIEMNSQINTHNNNYNILNNLNNLNRNNKIQLDDSLDEIENEDLLNFASNKNKTTTSEFFLKKLSHVDLKTDVNSTWIIENIFPNVKNICFIRFYTPDKLDNYRMTFRIKNFKTGQFLSIRRIDDINYKDEDMGILRNIHKEKSVYKFELVNENSRILSEEYQYSLFGFLPDFQSEEATLRAEKNQFLRVFHIATKSFLKIVYKDESDITKCYLTLTSEEEREVFKIVSLDYSTVWNFRFLSNMYSLFSAVTMHVKGENDNSKNSNKKINRLTRKHSYTNINQSINYNPNEDISIMTPEKNNIGCNLQSVKSFNEKYFKQLTVFTNSTPNRINKKDNLKNFSRHSSFSVSNSKLLINNKSDNSDNYDNYNHSDNLASIDIIDSINERVLKTLDFVLDKLKKFITNQFINKFDDDYDYKSLVFDRQILISKFGFTDLILRSFISDFWIESAGMAHLNELTKIIKKVADKKNSDVMITSNRERTLLKMYDYTDAIFGFMILFCKDNLMIKKELYDHLDVFLYFINLKESCVYGLIEIFKDNAKVLHSLKRDCRNNPRFRKAFVNIYKAYILKDLDAGDPILLKQLHGVEAEAVQFSNSYTRSHRNYRTLKTLNKIKSVKKEDNKLNSDSEVTEEANLISLIFEYVKISKYEKHKIYNNRKLLKDMAKETNAISMISREEFFLLLQSLVCVKNASNILENQREIIDKLIVNAQETEGDFYLVNYLNSNKLSKKTNEVRFPPCLSELLFCVAEDNPDMNIRKFLEREFKFETLFRSENKEFRAVNLKLISLFMVNRFRSENNENMFDKVYAYFKDSIGKIQSYFEEKRHKENNFKRIANSNPHAVNIDYTDKSEVNLLVSTICFLTAVYEMIWLILRKLTQGIKRNKTRN